MFKKAKNNKNQGPSTIASWYLTLLQAFDHLSLDTQALAQQADLPARDEINPNDRIPIEKMMMVWQLAVKYSNDDAIGVKVSDYIHSNTLNAVGLSLVSSGTIRQAWLRALEFHALISNVIQLSIEHIEGDKSALCFQRIEGVPCSDEAIDAFMATAVRLALDVTDNKTLPIQIDIQRSQHVNIQAVTDRLGQNIKYRQAKNRLIYLDEDLDRQIITANEALAEQIDDISRSHLNELQANSVSDSVRRILIQQLKLGELDKDKIASELAMSSRNLQRKLDQEKSSYSQLLKEVRLNLAQQLLQDRRFTVTNIALQLGFKDSSSFSKAFKEWVEMSPRDYRNSLC